VFAALAGAVVAALFVSSPWKTSPGFLEEVQAALTPPPGNILHAKIDVVVTISGDACASAGGFEVWIDTPPPHRFRAIVRHVAPPAIVESCPDSVMPPDEVGGLSGGPTLRFVPPNTLVVGGERFGFPVEDPSAFVLRLIGEGRAHREGSTQLDGQTVERVRFDPLASCPAPAAGHCPTEPEYGYFDPETFYPVRWDFARDPMFPLKRDRWLYRAFEYLPRTDDNVALTDIRAQHPDATGP
jgi:hypothetical protein